MIKITHKELTINIFDGLKDQIKNSEHKIEFETNQGNVVSIEDIPEEYEYFSHPHFQEDKLQKDCFEAYCIIDENLIEIIIHHKEIETNFKEILATIAHELGHLSNGNDFKNTELDYETKEGHQQEENKAIAFENFVLDSFDISLQVKQAFIQLGIKID